jgi:hypothetical protein
MPTEQELRELTGSRVTVTLTEAGGGGSVTGQVLGTLESVDGLVVYVEEGGRSRTIHSQHIAEVERAS